MNGYRFFIGLLFLLPKIISGQTLSVTCVEKHTKNPEDGYPILTRTCIIKKYKFKSIGYSDNLGRYTTYVYKVFKLVNKKWVRTTNSSFFNKNQAELVSIINARIQKDFKMFSSDSTTKSCFDNHKTIPLYKMDDFGISFQNNQIWFTIDCL
ncbi:MAG: hypothetical protein NVSMB45_19160 [Ginsengibacter sp.]